MRDQLSKVVWSLVVLAAGVLVACGSPPQPDGEEQVERRFVSLGTAPTGGAFFLVGGALAEVAGQGAGYRITAEATKGSQENIRRLVTGEMDFALSNASISWFAVRGEQPWDQPQAVQAVMTLAPNVALFVAPKSAGITSMADLRGKRVIIGPSGAGFEQFVAPILAAHGLSFEDMTVLNAAQSAAVDLLADGSADAAFLGGAVPTASITQAATSMDLVFVPFDEPARLALVRDYPFFEEARIPAGTYRGLDTEMVVLDVGSMHLLAATNTDEELVYAVTKAIWEGRTDVVSRHPAGRSIREGNVTRDTGTPFHPGAERFYREVGLWPETAVMEAETPSEATEPQAEVAPVS